MGDVALIVGAGPNGLAAAVTLARAGLSVTVLEATDTIGGGTRTVEGIVPGLLVDSCAAIHPMAVGSPFLNALGLERYGLTWRFPEVDCAHPLDDGTAGVLYRSVEQTASGLGPDAGRWRALFAHNESRYDALSDDIFQTALGRAADPREVSNLVVYLASDDSSYSTGSEFVVDGGCTAGLGHKDFSAVEVEQQPEWVT